MKHVLGIDVGGTGIKAAIVNTKDLKLISERKRVPTPIPATVDAIVSDIHKIINEFNWKGKPIGIGFPSLLKNNICHTAHNIDKSWIGIDLHQVFTNAFNCKLAVINDADAAGLSEREMFSKYDRIIVLTIGTGIGSCLISNGNFMSNIELGSMPYKNQTIEQFLSNKVRKEKKLSWPIWTNILNEYLIILEKLFSPDLIIIGGGISKKFSKYSKQLNTSCKIQPAINQNNAGIIGSALSISMQ